MFSWLRVLQLGLKRLFRWTGFSFASKYLVTWENVIHTSYLFEDILRITSIK